MDLNDQGSPSLLDVYYINDNELVKGNCKLFIRKTVYTDEQMCKDRVVDLTQTYKMDGDSFNKKRNPDRLSYENHQI